jgi:hypothetical protein
MARRKDGTTLSGYICDCVGCDRNGVVAPVVCVPFEGFPIEVRVPIFGIVDTHVCMEHWKNIKLEDQMTKAMMATIEEVAISKDGRPAFKRAFLRPVILHSQEYLEFQQGAGLVPPDDAVVDGSIEMPDI